MADLDLPIRKILKWIPVKSLMRFKAVSKQWLFIIVDPSFAKIYRGGFRGLLLCSEADSDNLAPPRDFIYLKIDGLTAQLSHQLTLDVVLRTTEAVKGLLCLYKGSDSYVCNVATHEFIKLPVSKISCKLPTYHFGYDPINCLYKLLKICPVYEDEDQGTTDEWLRHLGCEILTLGVDSSWRRINTPSEPIIYRSICVNGVLYWKDTEASFGPGNHLLAFDLAEENFSEIPSPLGECYYLPNFGFGSKKLFLERSSSIENGYVLIDIWHYRSGTWTDHQEIKMKQPSKGDLFAPRGILPDGEFLLIDLEGYHKPIYLYDETNGALEEVVLNGTPLNLPKSFLWDIFYHEETVVSLSHLIGVAST